ncbi:MAG: SRPBCC family protein [Leucobacter sp.]
MATTFTVTTRARTTREELFDASLDVDEHVASMSGSDERAVGGLTSGMLTLGNTVTWRARHFGVWFTMTVAITELSRPDSFVDEQQRGPFKLFRHEHRFESEGELTLMRDTITVASPVFGRIAERLVLVPYLRRLIRQRNSHLVRSLRG